MAGRDIIVIGASAGGVEVLSELCKNLPPELPAAVFIVWHMPATSTGIFPRMLERTSALPVENAVDGEPLVPGRIYTAPPDHHLLLEDGRVRLTHGPKENRFRPAVDPLFRSAAYSYGPRVIGLVLSGALDDGTSGLWMIKDRGGVAMVQDPVDALVPDMPRNALHNVEVDYVVPVSEMPALLMQLTSEPLPEPVISEGNGKEPEELEIPKRVERG
jgi:two-component system, chemotaxis family, protein-glutamate methylesterase/glutaminase